MLVSKGEEFLSLSVDEVILLLNRDELFVDNEGQIFDAAIRWLEHDPSRAEYSTRSAITKLVIKVFCFARACICGLEFESITVVFGFKRIVTAE